MSLYCESNENSQGSRGVTTLCLVYNWVDKFPYILNGNSFAQFGTNANFLPGVKGFFTPRLVASCDVALANACCFCAGRYTPMQQKHCHSFSCLVLFISPVQMQRPLANAASTTQQIDAGSLGVKGSLEFSAQSSRQEQIWLQFIHFPA